MKQLKGYNANVLTSTKGRAKLTLEFFLFSKVVTHFMKSQTDTTWPYEGRPTTVCEITFAILRNAISQGALSIPLISYTPEYKFKRVAKRNAKVKRTGAHKTVIKRPAMQKRPAKGN